VSVLEKDKAQLEGKLTAVEESAETLKDEVARIRDKLSTKTSTLRLERDDLTSKLATYGADLARMQSERDNKCRAVSRVTEYAEAPRRNNQIPTGIALRRCQQ